MDLKDSYRISHPTVVENTFFSAAIETFFKIDHILGHKGSLNKCKKTEIIFLYCFRPQWNKTRN
jgi:hypothetical protein